MKKRIIIVGGGFAGLSLVKGLANQNVSVLLIDRNNFHTFQPLLYQTAIGGIEPTNIVYPFRRIFRNKKNIQFKMAEVYGVDIASSYLNTSIGDLDYDYLVIATGSINNFFGLDPIKSRFSSLKTINDALDIRYKLMHNLELVVNTKDEEIKEQIVNIAVVGGGAAGIEIAGAITEMKKTVLPKDFPEFNFERMKISLFESSDRLIKTMSVKSSEAALRGLEEIGVIVNLNTRVKDFDKQTVFTEAGHQFQCSTVIWTAGVKGALLSGFSDDVFVTADRLKVNEFNQIIGQQNIFAIGDIAAKVDEDNKFGLPMMAPVAVQQGELLVKNIVNHMENKKMTPFRYKDKGTMATIGRNKAVVDLPKLHFNGRFAWFVWMFVHLMSLVGFRNKLITFINWSINYINYDRPINAIIGRSEKRDKS